MSTEYRSIFQSMAEASQPNFTIPVVKNGYAWWYVDGVSDDGRFGLTIIGFIGSVFSPYYASARRAGRGDPDNFVAMNACLYGGGKKRWSMTERGRSQLHRTARQLVVGPSSLDWADGLLTVNIAEISVPVPRRLSGQVRLRPICMPAKEFTLDREQTQTWQPIAPLAEIEVEFTEPSLRWRGHGYFDHNRGSKPLEAVFSCWDWSRRSSDSGTTVLYETTERDGTRGSLPIRISSTGIVDHFEPPPRVIMKRAPIWRISRETRGDAGTPAAVQSTLEDTPFYARSLVKSTIAGEHGTSVHESLDLDRFSSRIVQAMLPFRMPRRAR